MRRASSNHNTDTIHQYVLRTYSVVTVHNVNNTKLHTRLKFTVVSGVPRLQLKNRYPTNNNFAEYHSIIKHPLPALQFYCIFRLWPTPNT